jgi:hypothetical protein
MFTCRLDGAEFSYPQDAMKHIRVRHAELIADEWLYKYSADPTRAAEERALESLIKEVE